jgi:hypothetical protein
MAEGPVKLEDLVRVVPFEGAPKAPAAKTEPFDPRPSYAPPGSPLNDDDISPEFSEDRLALHFVDLHGNTFRYVAAWGKWFRWTGSYWEHENTLAVFDMTRKICREAAGRADKSNSAPKKGTIL